MTIDVNFKGWSHCLEGFYIIYNNNGALALFNIIIMGPLFNVMGFAVR